MGTAKIHAKDLVNGQALERKWLKLYHRSGRTSNFGYARVCVSVHFHPVGSVRSLISSHA